MSEVVPTVAEAIDAFCSDIELEGRLVSARSYGHVLARLRDRGHGSIRDLSDTDCRELLSERSRVLAPTSMVTLFAVLRSFCRWCVERGYLARNPTDGLPKPKQRRPAHRYLSAAQLTAMYQACRNDVERLIVVLCGGSGLRAAELLDLRWRDCDAASGVIRVFGKGRKWRELAPGPVAFAILERAGGAAPDPKAHVIPFRGAETVRYHVRLLARAIGLQHCTTHMLRHSFAVAFLEESGEDAFTLQTLLGHTSPVMTGYYLRSVRERAALRKQRAVDLNGRLFGDDVLP